ncbi:hypothetical protein [Bosea sp. (in: a-proteobacteria)]|uniref:hypothetical protein n=1 Tax=Bosea sp. (in: a-proteobacteria) TaxID=1871050 RepID=UPI0012073E0E|nr:hypothetical protein [Bosea sp. (in: a-proteobacteria)]TAJ30201.1 MAG: hypothetical protein EPO59_13110 [Bosea sp. (in: a-proteobacteria)]
MPSDAAARRGGSRMRLAGRIVLGGGLGLCLVTFAGWVWLNAYACACAFSHVRLRWEDTEALAVFIPPFVIGVVVMILGGTLWFGGRAQGP